MLLDFLKYFMHLLPCIPIVVILRILLILPRKEFRKNTTICHEIGVVAFAFYVIAVCLLTLNLQSLFRNGFQASGNYNLIPFAGISIMWNSPDRQHAIVNVFGNIIMFAPFGFSIPLLWRKWSSARVFLAGMAFSMLIETVQFFTGRGTDIDDVILNALGALAGYFAFWFFQKLLPQAAHAFRLKSNR